MAYFTISDIQLYLSPDLYHRWFGNESSLEEGWAGLDPTLGQDRFNALAEGACAVVDGHLQNAGFTVPITEGSMLPLVKRVAIFRFLLDLYVLAGEEIPDSLNALAGRADSELKDIAEGQIKLRRPPSSITGMGGNVIGGQPAIVSRKRLTGTFL